MNPESQSVEVTEHVEFTTTVSGVGKKKFRYQWRHNGVNINGGTRSSLTIDSATEDDGGTYECMVWNKYGFGCISNSSTLSE